jgi:hypothetical protein
VPLALNCWAREARKLKPAAESWKLEAESWKLKAES